MSERLSTSDFVAGAKGRGEERQEPAEQREPDRAVAPEQGVGSGGAGAGMALEHDQHLFPPRESEEFRSRWGDIQAGFVDEPRHAVEEADHLVAAIVQRVAEVFAEERSKLERQWDRGTEVSTEDLRQSLQRYRSFFNRLLSV
jgi:hypothetical protein